MTQKSKNSYKSGFNNTTNRDTGRGCPVLLQDIAKEWFEYTSPHIKESTKIKYYNIWHTYISSRLGKTYVNQITDCMLETFCNELLVSGGANGTKLSPKTTADALSVIRNILRFGVNKGYGITCDGHSVSVRQPVQNLRVLSWQEQQCLCEYLFKDLTNLKNLGILMCLYTGIRIGEICALKWEDISLTDKSVFIHQTMQRIQVLGSTGQKTKVITTTPKSGCSIRTIPLQENLVQIISCCHFTKHGYFLTGSNIKFTEPRTMQNYFKRILKACSIKDANYHSLRHTFATRCVESGFDMKSLSELLGHSNVNITLNRYVHPSMELKRSNMQKLSFPAVIK